MPKLNYANLTTKEQFALAATNFTKRSASLKADIQKAFICSLAFTIQHGDHESSILTVLESVKGMGKNLHRAAEEWVLAYSWLALDETSKSGFRKDATKVMNIEGAKAANWWETEKPPVGKPFDLQKAVQALFDKVQSEIEAGRLDKSTVQATLVAKLDNPELAVDLFDAMSAEAKNQHVAMLVARMTPAAEVEQIAEAA